MTLTLPPDTPKGQREAIIADDPTITVTAGAGTGKTWTLTERYARLLADTTPEEILTLTYTEAAAQEMKERITVRIALPDAELWVSTIHSFAARLIRESGLSVDIDPMASVITTRQAQDFWDSVRQAAEFGRLGELAHAFGDRDLRKLAEDLDNYVDFAASVAAWGSGALSRLAQDTAELHASSGRSYHDMLKWIEDNELLDEAKTQVHNILLPEWQSVHRTFASVPPLTMPKSPKPDSPAVVLNDILSRRDKLTPQAFYSELTSAKGGTGKFFTELAEHLGAKFSEWRDSRPKIARDITSTLDSPLTDEELRMRNVLLKFCALSWAMWDKMKTKRGLLSFSDMINHAQTAIDEGVKRRFKHILVDEFQDTDRLQHNMIKKLAEHSTTFFTVGDPKQSIYRFRHADPSLFAETIEQAAKNVELDTSFRTRAELLRIINRLFMSIWRNGLSSSGSMRELTYKPIKPVIRDTERDTGTMPVFKVIVAPHDTSTVIQGRRNLAEELARNIHDWVKSERTIWDKKERVIRPVMYSDIAILAPARSIYPILEEALERFGIKSIQDKSTDYFARVEINDVVCLLRATADMNDAFAVAGWLMSPLSGVSESEALRCLADADTPPIELIRQNFPDAYSRLEYYALVGEHEGPSGLISLFDRDRRWLSAYSDVDRMRVLRNLRLAVSLSRECEHSGTSSLVSCAEWLTRTTHDGVSYEEPSWHEDRENAVRLGTVHSAKGLEYPVAVVFDPRTRKKSSTDSLRPSRELGLVFTKIPDELGKDIKPKLAMWDKLFSEQGEEEEQTRLFYVAATRAQDSLIFCGMIDQQSQEPHKHTWTKLLLDNDDAIEPKLASGVPASAFPDLSQEQRETLRPVSVVKTRNSLRQFSASSFAMYELCPFAWRRSYRQGRTLVWEDPVEKSEDYDGYTGGAELGSLAHWILSRWPGGEDYKSKLDYYLHDREVLSHMPGHLRAAWRRNDRDEHSELKGWLLRFAGSDLGVMLRTRKDIKREYMFRLPLNEATSLAGSIDALFDNNIIDYKITSIDRTPKGLYESQLDFYALIIHELTGVESVKATIAFLREGTATERVITDFASIRERVSNAAEICATGPYTPNHEHCMICPFKKGCVNYAGV